MPFFSGQNLTIYYYVNICNTYLNIKPWDSLKGVNDFIILDRKLTDKEYK